MTFSTVGLFAGVFNADDAVKSISSMNVEPVWHDAGVAFGGAPVYVDQIHNLVICGDIFISNLADLRHQLDMPAGEPAAIMGELYHRYGIDAGNHAHGMFCLAIWDAARQELVLLRDSVGARTLYYATDGKTWWFASRLRTLCKTPSVSGKVSLEALRDYLTFSFVPGSRTMLQDVQELRPATALILPEGRIESYWEPHECIQEPPPPFETFAAQLRTLLETAIAEVMPTSEPVGVFLSGGIDSSLITALVARQAQGRTHTYSIHFGSEYPNELQFSSLVAQHCHTNHHIIGFSGRQIADRLVSTIEAMDDPIGDPLTVPNLLLGQEAAQNVGIIYNGEGGDPCFGGPKNLPMLLHELYSVNESRETAYLRSYRKCYEDLDTLLAPMLHAELASREPQETILGPFFTNPQMHHFLNKLMHTNIRLKGADQILTKVSNLTAVNNLLGISPLFDRRVVEMSFAVPPSYKLAGAQEKAVLKQASIGLLPDTIMARPKSGMLVPVQGWFRQELKQFAQQYLFARDARTNGFFNIDVIKGWLDYRGEAWSRQGQKLWMVLTVEIWLRING